jgi:hypothetical protein
MEKLGGLCALRLPIKTFFLCHRAITHAMALWHLRDILLSLFRRLYICRSLFLND